jgi:hypothetical protein
LGRLQFKAILDKKKINESLQDTSQAMAGFIHISVIPTITRNTNKRSRSRLAWE